MRLELESAANALLNPTQVPVPVLIPAQKQNTIALKKDEKFPDIFLRDQLRIVKIKDGFAHGNADLNCHL